MLARVFEPLLHHQGSREGLGLGLAQVFGFVKQSGGGIRIDTVVGEGTSIKVYLPRAEPREDTVAASDADAHKFIAGERTDSTRGRRRRRRAGGLGDRLSEAGYHVREAASGLQALQRWRPTRVSTSSSSTSPCRA